MTRTKKLIISILSILLFLVLIVYIIGIIHFKSVFFPGSYINNINYSGKTVAQVEANIADQLSEYRLTINGRNGVCDTIFAKDISYGYVSDGQIDELKAEQNPFLWPFSFRNQKYSEMQVTSTYSDTKLDQVISQLLFFYDDVVKSPENACIEFGEDGYYIKEEDWGTTLDTDKVKQEIVSALKTGETALSLDDTDCYINPTILSSDQRVQDALEAAQRYTNLTITYDFGDRTEVLDQAILRDWVTIDDDFQVTLDKQRVVDYVNYLGYYYTTFSSTRDFIRHDGKTIQVRGGDYGWIINRSKEVEELYALIESGKSVTREPVYSQTAKSRNKNDIGNTYVEVNLKKQHLWLFVNGEQIMDSSFVSGNTSRNYDTPSGIYAITYKERDATLTGQDYSSPVSYWMPFNKNIGFHDASWRKEFGGKIYKTNGSHGCINMPPKKAKLLYSNIEKGTPVVIY